MTQFLEGQHPTTMAAASMSSSCVILNKSPSEDSAASGIVIRDFHGRPISAASIHVGRTSVFIAEALTLRDSLVKAKEKGFTRVEGEGDSKLVIEAVRMVDLIRLGDRLS
ncbi:hypothetical protein ACLB2K_020406 [Fragaria x ananassa]